jgi:periplasmic protein TonB
MNPVAHEVVVIATGARPGDGSGKRELFTEETTTVLVFENGGVIPLDAAVAQGQLLFLTNKENKREVVAQVLRKRAFRPTSCYVELEFTEPSPGFWGIEFSVASNLLPQDPVQLEVAELVESSEETEEPAPHAPAPSAQDVEALKREVEALRQQLKSFQQAPPAPDGSAPEPPVFASTEPPPVSSASPAPPDSSAAKAFEAASADVARAIVAGERLPPDANPTFSEEDLLPKPALDFSKVPAPMKRPRRARGSFTPTGRHSAMILAVLVVVLIVVSGITVWRMHWYPDFNRAKPSVAANSSRPSAHPAQPSSALPAGSPQGPVAASATPTPNAATINTVAPAATASNDSASAHAYAAQPDAPDEPTHTSNPPKHAVEPRDPKHGQIRSSSKSESAPVADKTPDVGAFTEPKLIYSIRPNPPAEALANFVSGNVTLDALVDPEGVVKTVKVLSGHETLRQAAIDAVKQFRYDPATQNGKPTSAHVTVTVKFWYEP